eukprot:175295-Pyramimonas_sp.AAC.1
MVAVREYFLRLLAACNKSINPLKHVYCYCFAGGVLGVEGAPVLPHDGPAAPARGGHLQPRAGHHHPQGLCGPAREGGGEAARRVPGGGRGRGRGTQQLKLK